MLTSLKMIDLSGKHILITGASSGIGRAIAILAAKLGAVLTIAGRNSDRLNDTLNNLSGVGHLPILVDITDYDKLTDQLKAAINTNGAFSGFVHSAGIEKTLPLKATTPSVYRDLFEINVIAGFEIARQIARKDNFNPDGASFLYISSIRGILGEPALIAYSTSKSALLSGVKSMAMELASKKIRCNSILPGVVKTKMIEQRFEMIPQAAVDKITEKHPLGLGTPEDVANLAVFLMSDASRWITGSSIVIDGGYSAS